MRILVIGAGVQGSVLAADLSARGRDVTLLAGGSRGQQLMQKGLTVDYRHSPVKRTFRIPVLLSLEPDDGYDCIITAVRFTQLQDLIGILNANCSKNIILLGNDPLPDAFAAMLPKKSLLFAFCRTFGVCLPDRVRALDSRQITVGCLSARKLTKADKVLIAGIFQGTGYKVVAEPNMGDFLLCRAACMSAVSMACCRSAGDMKKLKHDRVLPDRVIDAVIEAYRALEKTGHKILPETDGNYDSPSFRRTQLRRLRQLCAADPWRGCGSSYASGAVEEQQALIERVNMLLAASGLPCPAWQELAQPAENT